MLHASLHRERALAHGTKVCEPISWTSSASPRKRTCDAYVDTRQLESLVGRTDEVRVFENFMKSENAQQVIAYWGVAGQGKSMLLRHLASMCSGGEMAQIIDLADIVPRYPSTDTGKHDYA